MKLLLRLIAATALFALWGGVAQAGQAFQGAWYAPAVTPPAYVGPGDVVSGAAAWYSCTRAYNAAYATGSNPACNFRRSSDNHTCDIMIATTGSIGNTANCSTGGDNGQTAASFCNSTSCFVTEAYDQTGNGYHVVQATTGNQPPITFNAIGSFLALSNTASSSQVLSNVSFSVLAQPFSFSAVAKATGSATGGLIILGVPSGGSPLNTFGWFSGSTNFGVKVNNVGLTTASGFQTVWVAANAVANTSSSAININGTETTGTVSSGSTTTEIDLMRAGASTETVAEAGFWNLGYSSGNRTALCQNQQAYYGAVNFGASC